MPETLIERTCAREKFLLATSAAALTDPANRSPIQRPMARILDIRGIPAAPDGLPELPVKKATPAEGSQ